MLLWSRRVRARPIPALAAVTVLVAAGARVLLRRVEVEGDSMRPTLLAGDRLLVVRCRWAGPGRLVVVAHPTEPRRSLVKRVAAAGAAGMRVVGDNPAASTDSRAFGPVRAVEGRVVYRYHPPHRAGRVS